MRKVQLTIKQEEVAPSTTSDLVVMNNGRTLKEELSTNVLDKFSREMTVSNSMSKIIDGTLDGVYESGVMHGRSLVNIKKTVEAITMTGSGQYKGFHLRSTDMIQDLKTDTDYLFVVNVTSNTLEGSTQYSLDFGNTDPNNPNQQAYFTARHYLPYNAIGTYKFVLRTKSSFENAVFISRNQILPSCTGGSITFSYMLLEYQEGMENWDIPFFTGLCDVKMPILHNVSSEVFCHDSLEVGTINGDSGANASSSTSGDSVRSRTKDMKKLNGASSVLFSDNLLGVKKYLFSYDSNGKYLGRTPSEWETGNEIATVEGAYYYRAVFTQLLENLPRSIYIIPKDHKSNILRTPETVTLRSIPNGVRDELNVMTGEYTKRIGQITLNGTENDWITIFDFNGTEDYSTFKLDVPLLGAKKVTYPINSYVADKLGNEIRLSVAKEFVHINNQPRVCIKLLRTKLSEQTVAGLKTWLSQNPITVQYELAEPMTTIVEPLTIPFAYENGHIILESGSEEQSLLPELKYSVPASKNGVLSTTSQAILKHEQRLHKLENLLLREAILMDYRLALSFLDKM